MTIHKFKMYQWKCLEKIAGGHHECSLLCILEDQGEKNKTSTAIEHQVHPLNNILFRLSDNLHSSDRTFDVPENGFESLTTLLEGISQSVQRAEGRTVSSKQPEATAPEFELRLASGAINAAAVAASAEAGAVGAATVAESVSAGQLLVRRAVAATLSGAGSAYQADGAGPSAAAGSLLSEVPFDNHGVVRPTSISESCKCNEAHQLILLLCPKLRLAKTMRTKLNNGTTSVTSSFAIKG